MKIKNDKKVISVVLLLIIILTNISQVFAINVGNSAIITNLGDCNEEHIYYTRNGVRMKISTKYLVYQENGQNYPAYCLNRELPGAEIGDYPVTVEDFNKISKSEEIWRVLLNGYPYKNAKQIGVENDMQAYICTKQAVYRIIDGESADNYSAVDEKGYAMVKAIKKLVDIGRNGTQTYVDPVITISKVNKAGVDSKDSNYISQTFYIDSDVNISEASIVLNTKTAPKGTFLADTNNNKKTTFQRGQYFKILIPRANITEKVNVQATIDGYCEAYPVLYGNANSNSVQDYALVTDPYRLSTAKFNLEYNPDGKIEINKLSSAYSKITGLEANTGLAGAKFHIKGIKTGFETTAITDAQGKILLTGLPLDTYIITELSSPDYYLINKEGNTYEVDITTDGQKVVVNIENNPVDIEVSVDKSADKKDAQGNEIVNYTIDNIKNLSNVKLDNFTLVDDLPSEVRIRKVETGTYNHDLKYSLTYNTNKRSNVLLRNNLSTKVNNVIDFTNLELADDEYVTSYSLNFGTVGVAFQNTTIMKVETKVVEGLADKSQFVNNVRVSGTYLEESTEDEDDVPVEVYENILKIKKVSKEYNQYTDKEAGTTINATFELLNENKEYVSTLNVKASEEFIYKYLETGKQFYLKEISTDDYYVISDKLIPFMFEENGQVIELVVENDNVNLVVDVEKEGPTQAEAGEEIQYKFNNVGNFSNTSVSNFIWGDVLPRQIRIQNIETGTWNEELTYKVQYITNRNTNWKTISEDYSTSENYTIDVSSESLNLPEGEYVKEFRFIFGDVKEGFKEVENPKVNAKVNEGLANNKIFVNNTYVTASYIETELRAEDDAHTIVYTKVDINKDLLPKTGIDD